MGGGRVAVVGGSIAGCAMALAASRGGAEQVTVFSGRAVNCVTAASVSVCTTTGSTNSRPPAT